MAIPFADIADNVLAQAREKYNLRTREDNLVLIPLHDFRRLVRDLYSAGCDRDIIHLQYPKEKNNG